MDDHILWLFFTLFLYIEAWTFFKKSRYLYTLRYFVKQTLISITKTSERGRHLRALLPAVPNTQAQCGVGGRGRRGAIIGCLCSSKWINTYKKEMKAIPFKLLFLPGPSRIKGTTVFQKDEMWWGTSPNRFDFCNEPLKWFIRFLRQINLVH